MADINTYLANALSNPTVPNQKQAEVAQKAQQKRYDQAQIAQAAKNAMIGNSYNAGTESASELELDIRELPPIQLQAKYGDQARDIVSARVSARNQLIDQAGDDRTAGELASDTGLSVASALTNIVGSLGSMGIQTINTLNPLSDGSDGARIISEATERATNFLNEQKSDVLKADQEELSIANSLVQRDIASQSSEDQSTIDELSDIGKEFLGSVGNIAQNPAVAGDITAQGVGSIIPVGRVSQALQTSLKAVAPRIADDIVEKAAGTASIGAIESSAVFNQQYNEALKTPFEDLAANSPEYQQLISEGVSPEDARQQVAFDSARLASAIQAPVALAVGSTVQRFERAPTRVGSVRDGASNIAKESVEETIQNTSGELASNIAQQKFINENQAIGENVGQAGAEGLVGGLGTSTVLQTPGLTGRAIQTTGRGVIQGGKLVANKLGDAIDSAADSTEEQNNKESPISDEIVSENVSTAAQQSQAATESVTSAIDNLEIEPEQKEKAKQSAESILNAFTVSEDKFDGFPDDLKTMLMNSSDMNEAMKKLEVLSKDKDMPEDAQNAFAQVLGEFIQQYNSVLDTEQDVLNDLDETNFKLVSDYLSLAQNITETPSNKAALAKAKQIAEAAQIAPITAESLKTPEGQANVQQAARKASLAPESMDKNTVDQVLFHIDQGNVQLPDRDVTKFRALQKFLANNEAQAQEAISQGILDPEQKVSYEIRTKNSDEATKKFSAGRHFIAVANAVQAGNTDLAKSRMNDLGLFVQHMQNKVNAMNEHYSKGSPSDVNSRVKYEALNPVTKKFFTSKKGLGITPTSKASIELARRVNNDAKFVAGVYNGLAESFPELELEPIQLNEISGDIINTTPVEELANTFKQAKPTQETVVEEPIQEQPETTQENTTDEPNLESEEESFPDITEMNDTQLNAEYRRVAGIQNRTDSEQDFLKQIESEQDSRTQAVFEANQESENTPEPLEEDQPIQETETTELSVEEESSIQSMFSNLFGGETNKFIAAFTFGSANKNKVIQSDNVIESVLSEIDSNDKASESDKELYKSMLSSIGGSVQRNMNQLLNSWLDGKGDKNNSRRQLITEQNKPVHTWITGSFMNIVNSDLKYDPKLQNLATFAGVQWLFQSSNLGAEVEASDVASIFGVADENTIPQDVIWATNRGMSVLEAAESLANKIKDYWNVRSNNDVSKTYTDGIPLAIAKEILLSMIKDGHLKIDTVEYNGKSHNRIIPTISDAIKNAESDSVIDQAVLSEPEPKRFIGSFGGMPKSETQLRNPLAKLTDEQKRARDKQSKVPFYTDVTMANLYEAIGSDGLLDLFGAGSNLDPTDYNEQHYKSLDGKNLSVSMAYVELQSTLNEMANTGDLNETPIYYNYAFSKVNRMQMLGRYNPQSSKLVREVLLPTWSTLDVSNPETDGYKAYMLANAQALGIKVHKQEIDASIKQAEARLKELQPVLDILSDWLDSQEPMSKETITELKEQAEAVDVEIEPYTLHALMDYAKYQRSENKTEFRTSMYLEADGVTNGPVNALVTYSSGEFTEDFLTAAEKGGLFIRDPNQTTNSYNAVGGDNSKDLYEVTADNIMNSLSGLVRTLSEKKGETARNQVKSILGLMKDLLGNQVSIEDGNVKFDRKLTKNPLTITIYGSGVNGISGNIVNSLSEELYAGFSRIVQARKSNSSLTTEQAFFGDNKLSPAEAKRKFDGIIKTFSRLSGVNFTGESFEKLEVPEKMKSELSKTFTKYFTNALVDSIETSLGPNLFVNMTSIRQATQVQSIVLGEVFKQRIQAKVDEKKSQDGVSAGEFLSQNEINEILNSLEEFSPVTSTGSQNFFVAGKINSDYEATAFGRSSTGELSTQTFVYGPGDSGVAGIPSLVIGAGDGQMMQGVASREDSPEGTLLVFDGMNMPLDKISEYSEKVNEEAYKAWMNNPFGSLTESFVKFVDNLDATNNMWNDPDFVKTMGRSLGIDEPSKQGILSEITALKNMMQAESESIAARKAVLQEVNSATDQMASAASPYRNEGETIDVDNPVNDLNKRYWAKINSKESDQVSKDFIDQGTEQPSGARVLSTEFINRLPEFGGITNQLLNVFESVIQGKTEVSVVVGSREQLLDYATDNNITMPELKAGVNGFYMPSRKQVFLLNPSKETLVHELIHAATYEATLAYHNNEDFGKQNPAIHKAVQNLESLMTSFMQIKPESLVDPETRKAVSDVRQVITNATKDTSVDYATARTNAMNEFVAWTLSNPTVSQLLENKKAPAIVRIAKHVLNQIKRIIWGNKQAPNIGSDFYSNIKFNAAILANAVVTPQMAFNNTTLFHNSSYGNDPRLEVLNRDFHRIVVEELETTIDDPNKPMPKMFDTANAVTQTLSQEFDLDMQQESTMRVMLSAMLTQAQLNPASMNEAQKLYAHVIKKLEPESFMENPEFDDPNDRQQAVRKFDVITGKDLKLLDDSGRSTLLPTFIALAAVSGEFRDILSSIELPNTVSKSEGTLNSYLESKTENLMNELSQNLSGLRGKKNVPDAVDALVKQIVDVSQDRETYMDTVANIAGSGIDTANDYVVNAADKLGKIVKNKGQTLSKSENAFVKASGRLAVLMGTVASKDTEGLIGESVMKELNKVNVVRPIHKFMSEIVGRTKSNAGVYDMIKATKSFVQQTRQKFREDVPRVIKSKFNESLTDQQWSDMYKGFGKTDLVVLFKAYSSEKFNRLVTNSGARQTEITRLEAAITEKMGEASERIFEKSQQLATYMNTGVTGSNLLRNAYAINQLFGEAVTVSGNAEQEIDQLVSLYAFNSLDPNTQESISSLVQNESNGVSFVLSYLNGQREEEIRKAKGNTIGRINMYKGHLPSSPEAGANLIIAPDTDYSKLRKLGFTRLGQYESSKLDSNKQSRGYYYSNVGGKTPFNQGILQNVRQSISGVDATTGISIGSVNAGVITDSFNVNRIAKRMNKESGNVRLLPVYDAEGKVVAFERGADPSMVESLNSNTNLAEMIGVWRGRQAEEITSNIFNAELIGKLGDMYKDALKESPSNKKQFINVFEIDDPILKDAVGLINSETLEEINATFPDGFYVRKDLLDDAFGYRSASVGDIWTGNSRWDEKTIQRAQKVVGNIFGNKTYRYLVTGERVLQNVVLDAKTLIVVKSVVVPAVNMLSNILLLTARGVPQKTIWKELPKKTTEINEYIKSRHRYIEAEAELRAADTALKKRKLENEIQAIEDNWKRMSIYPLIEAGEFTSISDATIGGDEIALAEGRLHDYMETLTNKLPPSVQTLGKYALVTKDTALFKGMQRAIDYGDFISKAVMFEDLTKRKGISQSEALGRITEEYVNYDRLPGRFRGYIESMGLLWFYNFKIRSTKVALSMIKNNPVHTFFAMMIPMPNLFGSVGLPTEDSIFAKMGEGNLDYSVGWGQGISAPSLNPWYNLVN